MVKIPDQKIQLLFEEVWYLVTVSNSDPHENCPFPRALNCCVMESHFICAEQKDSQQVSTCRLLLSGRACPVPAWLAIRCFLHHLRVGPRIAYPSCVARCTETFVTTEKRRNKMFAKTTNEGRLNQKPRPRRYLLALSIALLFVVAMYPRKANAQIVGELQANIPFQFQAGNAKLPAGTYRIRMLDDSNLTLMQISTLDGSRSALFQVQDSDANSAPAHSELIFNKYGDQYFLAELFDEGDASGSKVIESNYETKISQGTVTTQEHVPVRRPTQQGN